ncbi:pirin family protein [Microbulbifer rhizosphaerae]|uniref:Pirin N-terminal domain-containing protein n=1 Tax=Microbulbifer rhizosphaerae TaxID=1562603 RepID=A0A7W4WAM8_9GAMM|nr:pirin family protein [Microbulbifer rhizosphaerae]MBB3060081.1 hypothetical protein [Microbulbifer rhizosphaerae]
MIQIRKANERGSTKVDWLNSRHTFSFGHYYDPQYMGFRTLRVINEDRVIPGGGFEAHSHRDMEIISYVLSGALEHKDNLGNGSVVRPGEVQRMSAGTGISHSEFNHSKSEGVHFLQIWIEPGCAGLNPGYEQKVFAAEDRLGCFQLVGDQFGSEGAVTIHQDVRFYLGKMLPEQDLEQQLTDNRYAWIQVLCGDVTLFGHRLESGDGVAVSGEHKLELHSDRGAELMLFDLA